jgi:hypothetical protein
VPGVRVAAAIVAAGYLLFGLEGATGHPKSWDGVAYHLPLAVKWLQEGSFAIEAGIHWRESLPANAEIVAMMAIGTGWHGLGELWNLASTVGLAAGSYLVARGLGVAKSAAEAGVLLVVGLPVVLYQTYAAYVDLFGAAALVAAVGLLVTAMTSAGSVPRATTLVVVGLGCGLAIGTKPTLWVPAALVVIAGLGWWLRARALRSAAAIAILLAAVAAPCLFWFARAFAATGNPLYPLALEVAGQTLGESGFLPSELTAPEYYLGLVRSRVEWLGYPWIEYKRAGYGWSTGSGLGPFFAGFVPVGVLYTVMTIRRRAPAPARLVAASALIWLALVAISWWLVGQGPHLRFGLPMIAVCCVLATPLIGELGPIRPRLMAAMLVTAAMGFTALGAWQPTLDLIGRVRRGAWSRQDAYSIPALIDSLPRCATVVNYNFPREFWSNFALAGRDLSNRVVPPWESREFLDRRPTGDCPIYVVDRAPFLAEQAVGRLTDFGYQPVPLSDEPNWRVWRWSAR